jgi:hypothetical protein
VAGSGINRAWRGCGRARASTLAARARLPASEERWHGLGRAHERGGRRRCGRGGDGDGDAGACGHGSDGDGSVKIGQPVDVSSTPCAGPQLFRSGGGGRRGQL